MSDTPALDDSVVLWSADPAQRAARPLLVMLHGYGADERDLFGLVPYLPHEYVIAAPRAPLSPPWPSPGYSWYAIEGMTSATRGSGAEPPKGSDGRNPEHVSDAASRLIEWIDTLGLDVPVGLLGFSQGAAVAIQAVRLQPERFSFVLNLSGYATPGELPGDAALLERHLPAFWGRGTHDDVIPQFLVDHTVQWLPEHFELSGRVYQGLTHSVSEPELDDVFTFLAKRLHAGDAAVAASETNTEREN